MLVTFVLHVYFICTTLYQHNIRVSQCYATGIPWHVMFIQICMCGLHRFLACRRCCGPFVSFFIQLFIDTARSRVYETVERPSICLSVPSIDSSSGVRRVSCWTPRGRRYRSIADAGALQQSRPSTVLRSKCGHCHVDSRGTKTDLLYYKS